MFQEDWQKNLARFNSKVERRIRMQNHFPVIRNDCLPAVAKSNNGVEPFMVHVNYVTGLIACTIPRKSILSKITYTC